MKNSFLFGALVLLALQTSAEPKLWVGGHGGDWNTAENWNPVGVPTKADIAVFRSEGTVRVDLSAKPVGIGGLRFETGTTILHTTLSDVSGSASGSPLSLATGTNEFYAAAGAVGVVSNVVNGTGTAPLTATVDISKTGAGEIAVELPLGTGYGYVHSIDVREGTLSTVAGVGPDYCLIGDIVIRDGAMLKTGHVRSALFSFSSVEIEAGGTWDCCGVEQYCDGLSGAGALVNASSLKVWLSRAPYVFGGSITGVDGARVAMTFNAKAAALSVDDWAQYLGSADAFANVKVTLNAEAGNMLRFAPGVGTFRVGEIVGNVLQYLDLDDVDGNPVTLYADFSNPGTMNLRGSGSFYQTGSLRSINSSAADFSQFSGKIGVVPGMAMYVGNNSAASVPDVSKVAAFEAQSEPSKVGTTSAGWLLFQNKGCDTMAINGLLGDGLFSFLGPATIAQAGTTGAAFWLNENADVTVCGGSALLNGNQLYFRSGAKLTIRDGAYVGKVPAVPTYGSWTQAKRPAGVNAVDKPETGAIDVRDGGQFFSAFGLGAKTVTVSSGGTFALGSGIAAISGTTAGDPTQLTVDGGTLSLHTETTPYTFSVTPDSDAVSVSVGSSGMTIDCDMELQSYSEGTHEFKFQHPITGVGGVVRTGGGFLWGTYPWTISGAFDNRDGVAEIHPEAANIAAATVPLFGSGDFRLGNARLQFRGDTAATPAVTVQVGTGGAFAYDGAATVRTRSLATLPQHGLELGALTRGGPGAALFFWNATGAAYDESCGRVTFATAPEQTAAGRIAGPVFTFDKPDTWNYGRVGFASYADGSLVSFDGYADGLGGGADSVALVTTGKLATVTGTMSVAALRVDGDRAIISSGDVAAHSMLHIPSGARLCVGSGSDPACVILNNRYSGDYPATIKGAGVLDFGSREGVVAVNGKSGGVVNFARIDAVISGSGGLSIVGLNDIAIESGLELRGANDYTGGTRVNSVFVRPTTSASFAKGDVWLGDGELCGGGLQLDTEGLVVSNGIHAAGWGPKLLIAGETTGRGAIVFKKGATLAGGVEAYRPLRIGALDVDGLEGVFAGCVSGDKIQIWAPVAGSPTRGTVVFSGSNTYTGGTEVVNSTLVLRNGGTAGTGPVWLSDGTLAVEGGEAQTVRNRITGVGTIRVSGKGEKSFSALESQDGAGFALDVGKGRRVFVRSLRGFSSITSSASGPVELYVSDVSEEGTFVGPVAPNVTLRYGERQLPGAILIVR